MSRRRKKMNWSSLKLKRDKNFNMKLCRTTDAEKMGGQCPHALRRKEI
jgi:hypothetical protein